MRLIKCYVENFGLLHEYECSFNPTLNCFLAPNGTGKTTLGAFIKAMLYGFGEGRKSDIDENERKRYNPWQGGKYGGTLTFSVNNRRYTVERSFGARASDDTFTLYNADTGSISGDYTENLGYELFNIDREGFAKTVFLSERSIYSSRANATVAARLSDLVGSDGDIGEYDTAKKRLDERRKFYYMRGGKGEIGNLTASISAKRRELDGLVTLREGLIAKEDELRAVDAEIAGAERIRGELCEKIRRIEETRARQVHLESYRGMLSRLDDERKRLDELKRFFGGEPPKTEEIDEARDLWVNGKRMKDEALRESGNEEFRRLSEYFSGGTDFAELDRIERTVKDIAEKEAELKLIDEERDEASREMRRLFPAKLPEESEIDGYIAKAEKKRSVAGAVTLALGIALIVLGAMLGAFLNTALYALSLAGAIGVAIGAALLGKRGDKGEIDSFIGSIEPSYDGSGALGALYRKKNELARYHTLRERRNALREELIEAIETMKLEVLRFLERFPAPGALSISDAVKKVREDYSRYYSMSIAEERVSKDRSDRIRRGEENMRRGAEFIARYEITEDGNPFEIIRSKVTEYNYRNVTVARLEEECRQYKLTHGIADGELPREDTEEKKYRESLADIEEQIKALKTKRAILERDYEKTLAECERIDEVRAEIAEMEEKLEVYNRNYSAIQMAMELLSEASERITSRYIGKTRERFIHYESAISGGGEEFNVNTDFAISRNDRGAARPEEYYSRGERELYALSMRLALADSLYEGSSLPFLCLDDPFISLDDERTERAKALLRSIAPERQIIYFTCSKSRAL